MTYWLQNIYHTDGEKVNLGESETEALRTLQESYDLDLEDVFNFCMEGYIWETVKGEPQQ